MENIIETNGGTFSWQKYRERCSDRDGKEIQSKGDVSQSAREAIINVVDRMLHNRMVADEVMKDIVSISYYQIFFDAVMKRSDASASVLDDIASGYDRMTVIID